MKRSQFSNSPDVLMDHWKISKNKELNAASNTQYMKGFLNHWKLSSDEARGNGSADADMNGGQDEGYGGGSAASSIYLLVNSSDVDVNEDFDFGQPDTEIVDQNDDEVEEIIETPPNQRKFSQSRKPLPKVNLLPDIQSFTTTSPRNNNNNRSYISRDSFTNNTSSQLSNQPAFQSFRLTSDGITEVVPSPSNGRRFKLTKEGIKEISSRRI